MSGPGPSPSRLRDVALLPMATEEAWNRQAKAPVSPQRDYLTVVLGDEEYGIEIRHIREIIKVRPATEVPRAPPFVLGVISVRGVVLPVVDLRQRVHLAASGAATPAARYLVVAREEELFGLLVDEVRQVVRLGEDTIEPPPMLAGMEADFIAGIARPDGRMVILLQLEPILQFEIARRVRREEPR